MKILVAPLDWGLGHATRCVPIVRTLLENGHEPIIAAGGKGYTLLKDEFPDLPIVNFPNYQVWYARSRKWFVPMIYLHVPGFLLSTIREHFMLKRLHRELGFDLVISDNRYGLYNRDFPCVFISHQIFIRSPRGFLNSGPFIEGILLKLTTWFLRRYAEVWVPDYPGTPNLAGDLSHKPNKIANLRYIGPLTSFRREPPTDDTTPKIDVLAIISGVEPQRTVLEEILREQLADDKMGGTRLLALGLPDKGDNPAGTPHPTDLSFVKPGELNSVSHLNRAQIEKALRAADTVICRSGYTTVMEVAALGKKNVLMIPTPSQTEQEYIGDFLMTQNIAISRDQENFDLAKDIPAAHNCVGFGIFHDTEAAFPTLAEQIADHPLFQKNRSNAAETIVSSKQEASQNFRSKFIQ